jgi:hypothetical protein
VSDQMTGSSPQRNYSHIDPQPEHLLDLAVCDVHRQNEPAADSRARATATPTQAAPLELRGPQDQPHRKHLQGISVGRQGSATENSPVTGLKNGSAMMEPLKIRYTAGRLLAKKKLCTKDRDGNPIVCTTGKAYKAQERCATHYQQWWRKQPKCLLDRCNGLQGTDGAVCTRDGH